MNKPITPPDWKQWDKNMFLIVQDLQQYFETYTVPVDAKTVQNTKDIGDLGTRVTALEHNKPIGPGGDGAFLALGGTPSTYPTPADMEDDDGKKTSFLVVARDDGIWFYNPKNRKLIPPKSDGGTIAIQAQFPQIFQKTHAATHNGRQGMSGVYTADTKDQDLDAVFTTHGTCIMLIVVNDQGEEYQTAVHPDGIASRIFRNGVFTANWTTVGGGSGAPVDPGVIQDIHGRLTDLEAYNHDNTNFINLDDTPGTYTGHQFKAVTVRDDEMGVEFTPIVTKDVYDAEILNQRAIDKAHDDHVARIDAVLGNNETRLDYMEQAIPNHTARLDAHDIRIQAIEIGGGGGGSADIGPLLVRLTALEDEDKVHANRMDDMDLIDADHETRITDLETSPSIPTDLLDRVDDIEAKNVEQDDRLDVLESTPSDVTKAALASGDTLPVEAKGVSSRVYVGWDTVWFNDSAKYEHVIFWGNSTKRGFELPDIADHSAETIADKGVVRVGRKLTITNRSTTSKFIRPTSSCTVWRSDTDSAGGEFNISPGYTIVLTAWKNGANKHWVVVGSYDNADVPLSASLQTALTNGSQQISWNTLGADPVSSSGDITAASMGGTPFCVGMGTSTGKKFIMAEIVDRTVSTLTSTQVREGRTTYIVNMSTQPRTVELTGGCKFNMTGSNVTTNQTIPPKAVWVFCPGIYSNGDKVWTFLGGFSSETIDFRDLVDRVTALEALPPPTGVSDFLDLTDTPTDYTGHGEKLVVVKKDESGLEFIEHGDITDYGDRIQALEDTTADHLLDFEMMGNGNMETSWNGLGAPSISQLNDVTAENIATSPFCIAQGSVAGKKFVMPNIVAKDTKGLGSTDVREGRTTYLINLSTVSREVTLTAGCKFNMTGGAVTTVQTIPRKAVWLFSPTLAAGDKVWTFIGALSAESLDISQLVARLTAVEAEVAKKPVSSEVEYKTLTGTGNVQSATIGDKDVVVQELLSSSNPIIWLPIIVDRTKIPANNECWIGKRYVFLNRGNIDTTVRTTGTAVITMPDRTTTTILSLKKGHSVELVTTGDATNGVWTIVRMGPIDNSEVGDQVAGLKTGNTPVHPNAVGATVSGSSGAIGTSAVASTPFLILPGTTARNIDLPEIVAADATSLTNTQVRQGRVTYVGNVGTSTKTMKLNTNQKFYINGAYVDTDVEVPKGTVLALVPAIYGSQHAWTLIGSMNNSLSVGKEKFSELTDTPSGYTPNQVLRYNASGTAVISTAFDFKNMGDTPNDYSGHKNKMLVVNNGETAIEFKNVPDTSGLQTEIDNNHNAIIALQNADTIINGKVTTLETDVADLDGRVTTLEAGGGSTADFVTKASLADGTAIVEGSKIGSSTATDWDTVTQAQAAARQAVIFWGNANNKFVTLPDIVAKDADTVPANAVRTGRVMYVSNRSTTNKLIKVANSCVFNLGGHPAVTNTTDYTLTPGTTASLISHITGSEKHWVFLGVFTADSSKNVTFADVEANTDWRTKVETGVSSGKVNSNCIYGAMQIKDGALSAEELASCSAGYVTGSTARTCTLPKVVDVNAANLAANEARFGKQIRMVNMSTQTMTINVQGGGRIYKPDGGYATSITLAATKFADFHAVWMPGFNAFAWIMMVP